MVYTVSYTIKWYILLSYTKEWYILLSYTIYNRMVYTVKLYDKKNHETLDRAFIYQKNKITEKNHNAWVSNSFIVI